MRHFAVFIAVLGVFSGFLSGPGNAQEQTPGFDLPLIITPDDIEEVSVDFDSAFYVIENPFLSDTLKLNYQISLLQKLAERQSELKKIVESYEAMGIPYPEPPPARGICAQLPPNALCLKHYPELYAGLVQERKAYYDDLAAKALAADPHYVSPENSAEVEKAKKKAEQERKAKEAAEERRTRYQWTEVACSGGECHGVLIAPKREGYRTTVRKGMRLSDGTVIQDVSADGVRVVIDKESIRVRPASTDLESEENAQTAGDNPVAEALTNLAAGENPDNAPFVQKPTTPNANAGTGGTPANTSPALELDLNSQQGMTAGNTASGTATGQTVGEPALGPSGLF